jgi:hypothetical protein
MCKNIDTLKGNSSLDRSNLKRPKNQFFGLKRFLDPDLISKVLSDCKKNDRMGSEKSDALPEL